jgi:phasin family protein
MSTAKSKSAPASAAAAAAAATTTAVSATANQAVEAAKHIEEAVAVGQKTIESVVKVSTEAAYDKAVALSKDRVEAAVKAGTAAYKGYEDVIEFNRENVDAFVKSGLIVARGLQDLNKTLLTLAQDQVEQTVAAGRALVGVKSLRELVDIQSGLVKGSVDKLVAESSKISEVGVKLAEEALAPISARVNVVMEKALSFKA